MGSGWVRTSTYKNCTRRNRVIYFASYSESDAGNCVILLPSIELRDPRVPIKHDDWDIEPSKDTSSTAFVCAVVAVRSPYQRVPLTVNQSVKESTRSSSNEVFVRKLKNVLVGWPVHCAS